MKKVFFWIGVLSFIAIGVEAVFLKNQTGQVVARVLVIIAVLSNLFSRGGGAKLQGKTAIKSPAVEVASIVSLLGGLAMAYLVFLTPIGAPYRTAGILASTLIATFAFVLANALDAQQANPS